MNSNKQQSSEQTADYANVPVVSNKEESVELKTKSVGPSNGQIADENLESVEPNNLTGRDDNNIGQAGKLINRVPDLYQIRAEELLNLEGDDVIDTVVREILKVQRIDEFGWVFIGISAYSVWEKTPASNGGAGNIAPSDEGKINALRIVANKVTEEGGKVNWRTLYRYVQLIREFLEKPMKEFAESDEEVRRSRRNALLKQLFLLPQGFFRTALKASDPQKALDLAIEKRVVLRDNSFTIKQFNKEVVEPEEKNPKGPNGVENVGNGDALVSSIDDSVKLEPNSTVGGAFELLIEEVAKNAKVEIGLAKNIIVLFQRHVLNSVTNSL